MSRRSLAMIDKYLEDDYEFDELLQLLDEIVMSNNPTDKTIASRYSTLKKYLRENHGEKFSETDLKKVRPDPSITNAILERDAEMKSHKKNIIFNDELINKILGLRDNYKNDYELAIYLQFISGRRIDEIKDAKYIAKSYKDNLKMMLSKNKSDDFFNVRLIPDTLVPKDFKKKLDILRSRNNDITENDWNKRLNKYIKKIVRKDLTSHNLRGLYATYMYNNFNPEERNINGFISDVLNHKTDDASLSYSNYKYEK